MAKSSLTLYLYSFGFKYSGIPQDPTANGGGFVFDCRALPNPFWLEHLRPYSGLDEPIVRFMENEAEVQEYARHAEALVLFTARTYQKLERERLMVSFGCTGGRHRSVYQAQRLAGVLEQAGFTVQVVHLDVQREEGRGVA